MKLTIGMCTYDDYDGVYFTIQSILLFHSEIRDDIFFVVVDGNPDSAHGSACHKLVGSLKNKHGHCGLYVRNTTWQSSASKNFVFEFSKTPYVLCMDCHVMVAPGAIQQLIDFCDKNPTTNDLHHGPLLDDNMIQVADRFNYIWSSNMLGQWAKEPPKTGSSDPYQIPMSGMGLFTCRKDAWLGFNRHFNGFGAEEGYIHKKFQKAGHKIYLFPWMKWIHRFSRPNGVPIKNKYIDRIRNYFIGWAELGEDPTEIINYFSVANTIKGQERAGIPVEELKQIQKECAQLVLASGAQKGVEPNDGQDLRQEIRALKLKITELEEKLNLSSS